MRGLVSIVITTVALGLGAATGADAAPPVPEKDPFYVAPAGLRDAAPGAVLRSRQIALSVSGITTPYAATQVLYRSVNQLGEPTATVATIVEPPVAASPRKLMSYQIAYDCNTGFGRPSFQLAGGQPSSQYVTLEAGPALSWLAQGYTLVTSDYEGPTDDYGAGREAGAMTLDGIRAAQRALGMGVSTPVGMLGSSGGGIATVWAAELHPRYAPELNIIGAASGGIPVHFGHVIDYVDGQQGGNALPYVVRGLMTAYRFDMEKYFSAKGLAVMERASKGCLSGDFPNFSLRELFKPVYLDWKWTFPEFFEIVNDSIMGRSATPTVPMLLASSTSDGIGDGIMVSKDTQQLAHGWCAQGANVEYREYAGLPHVAGTEALNIGAAPLFFAQALAGQAKGNCGTFGPGNALDPLPVPARPAAPAAAAPKLRVSVAGLQRRARGLVVRLTATGGTVKAVTLELRRSGRTVATASVPRVGKLVRRAVLRVRGRAPRSGSYTLVTRVGGRVSSRRALRVRR